MNDQPSIKEMCDKVDQFHADLNEFKDVLVSAKKDFLKEKDFQRIVKNLEKRYTLYKNFSMAIIGIIIFIFFVNLLPS